ncbi:MAG: hypothetical protein RR975_14695 [Clostridia bacterium]
MPSFAYRFLYGIFAISAIVKMHICDVIHQVSVLIDGGAKFIFRQFLVRLSAGRAALLNAHSPNKKHESAKMLISFEIFPALPPNKAYIVGSGAVKEHFTLIMQ